MRAIGDQRIKFTLYTSKPILITGKEVKFYVSHMKPFIFDSAVTDPVDIVRRDYMENLVNKILQRRGNPK